MFTVYVLFSPTYRKISIGFPSDLENRFDSHNIYFKKDYTTKYRPWEICFTKTHPDKESALKREKELKSARGRKFILQIIEEKFD